MSLKGTAELIDHEQFIWGRGVTNQSVSTGRDDRDHLVKGRSLQAKLGMTSQLPSLLDEWPLPVT